MGTKDLKSVTVLVFTDLFLGKFISWQVFILKQDPKYHMFVAWS